MYHFVNDKMITGRIFSGIRGTGPENYIRTCAPRISLNLKLRFGKKINVYAIIFHCLSQTDRQYLNFEPFDLEMNHTRRESNRSVMEI